jgi:DNA polymerase-3 subunit epsilon
MVFGVTNEPVALPRFAVVDIETSGLSTRRHRILQIGLVTVVGGQIAEQWSTLVRLRWPWQRVGPRKVHGLTRGHLRDAPTLRTALTELAGRLDGAVFTAHNADFDAAFIERAARRERVALHLDRRLCTLRLSRELDPDRALSHRLSDICTRYGVALDRPHDALQDALAAAAVLPHLLAEHGIDSDESLAARYAAR